MSLEWIEGVPADWRISKAQFVLDYQKRDVQEDDEIVTAFRDGQVTLRRNRRTDGFTMAEKEIGYQHVCEGDLVVHSMDGGFGAIGVSDSCGKVSPVVHAYTSSLCDLRFVAYQLRAAVKAGWIAALAKGIRVRSTQFDRPALASLNIAYPAVETQQRIADYLDRETAEIDAAVADLDKYVELLETRRQLHIDQTFSALLENWPLAPLGLFFSILNGDRGVNYPKAEEITQAGIPFINAGDVTERRISLSQAKFVSEEKYESMGGAKLRQGDILFCLRGSLGKHGLVDFDGGSVASSLCVLRPKNANTYRSRFLNLYLDSKFIESEVRFSENGSAQPNLSADSLSRFKVPAVSTEQQENVSTSLEEMHKEIDSLIAESTRLRDLLLKRRSVLITEVVTGRKQV
ncbi:MAG: restriction endonuclease subunit S [Bifidobacterium crudilactis]|nr:restriction endonuclease subunit S [Bifidobacterium crudilactis]